MDPSLQGVAGNLVAQAMWEVGKAYFERRPAAVEAGIEAAVQRSSQTVIDTDRPATIYWLGNDLMNIETQALLFESPMKINELLISALNYVRSIGFAEDEVPVTKLLSLTCRVEEVIDVLFEDFDVISTLAVSAYADIIEGVEEIKWYLHTVLKLDEEGFEKERVFLED